MDRPPLEALIDEAIALTGDGPGDPIALTFLLRCYSVTDRADLGAVLEPALAAGLEQQALARTGAERAAWLTVFADALALSADERLRAAAAALVAVLRAGWGQSMDIADTARTTEACLHVSRRMDTPALVAEAVDEIERVVGPAYRPGAGLMGSGPAEAGSRLVDHVELSSALLAAYGVTARLPYPMLAEELMRFARQTWWSEGTRCFADPALTTAGAFELNCRAARALCGLAALHRDPDYVAAAVIGPDGRFLEDAVGMLESCRTARRRLASDIGAYGLALLAVSAQVDS